MGEYLTTAEFGRALHPPLTPAAIRAAVRAGRIQPALQTESGVRLYSRAELDRFQAQRSAKAAGVQAA